MTALLRRARKPLLQILAFVVAVVLTKIVSAILDEYDVIQAATPLPVILLGAIVGMTYGLLAVGIVLVYRSNRIINFAHGQIGAFGAAFFGVAAVQWHIPYWIAFAMALIVSAATAAAAETGVVRRLRSAPRIVSIVATLGVGQLLAVVATLINSTASGPLYPQPAWLPAFDVGDLHVTQAYSGMLFLSPLVVLAIVVFLKRSRFGLAVRASAANPEAARMSGIFASRMSTLAWAIAGALAAFTAILTAPTQGFVGADSFGPALLLRALTAAVIGRMRSMPIALASGVGLGVLEQLLLWNYPQSGLVEVAMFLIILVTLLVQRRRGGRDEEKGSWAAVQGLRAVPEKLRGLWAVRALGPTFTITAIAALAIVPLFVSNSLAVTLTGIIAFSIVGLSIGVLTGLGGQLTLGQFAVAAIGAVISFQVSSTSGNFALALLLAGLGAGLVSVVIGLPALRIRGLMLTVTTLGFALAAPAWLLTQQWMLGEGQDPGKPAGWPLDGPLDTGGDYYYFALALFVVSLALAWNIRRSGFRRLLVAVRDNEENARAFAVRTSLVKLQGYLVGGFIAGIGGATYAHSLSSISAGSFPTTASIDIAVMTVLGGMSALIGPVLGAIWVLGLPLLDIGNIGLAATKFGVLLLILWKPGGLIQVFAPVRDWIVKFIARRHGIDPEPLYAGDDPADPTVTAQGVRISDLRVSEPGPAPAKGVTLLEARDLRKSFGGVHAVRGVSFEVRAGETVGLIGPNGAGKTTTFELLGGFTKPDNGQVFFNSTDISKVGPEGRARRGLIRSFQDAALFPTMTVKETVMLSLERVQPTGFLTSTLGVMLGERKKERQARALIAAMGLDRYRDKPIQELSTGTRRITEIACLVALRPTCLLLDEPSSGVAQRETEALGHLLVELKRELDLTLVVIEHDIPLIMGISDRVIAMADGGLIAEGPPDVVRTHPRVVDAYLGGSITAIERSGAAL
ncbi:branched-chain amino acid ABC transporter permease/ATP-binding protein [Actinocrispum wychmicini]|uniref:ABC-type branched-subunit amino acid transport system ATPase component n=1 Tax=Actinocrispum wychmicini TaxID=1213861 RepID=A0A4R2JRW5_9PSEU|nr:branched-chain amino acid ABC transporter permease/ATP-binding protein [Actinocrispum wychmicini]TCO59609.1 ABC-type branched-subunit amino acid transport system ATPase component [Actinocrispum wychmicini]